VSSRPSCGKSTFSAWGRLDFWGVEGLHKLIENKTTPIWASALTLCL